MRLKEIKPGMVIHCKSDKEKKALLEEAERIGYLWANGDSPTKSFFPSNTLVFREDGLSKNISWTGDSKKNTEFSDLILPELTAEEVLNILSDIRNCAGRDCDDCPLSSRYNDKTMCVPSGVNVYDSEKLMNICWQWKSDHEKKEPEIETEWFWQGRILKILKDGCYYQIKDGTVFYDTGCKYRESAEEYMKDELKEYCKTHEGEFIAVVEHVCRVKAVE